MFKNKILNVISALLATFTILCCLFVYYMGFQSPFWLWFSLLTVFLIIFLGTTYLLNKNIDLKIKKLYQLIYETGSGKKSTLDIRKVEKEVSKWSDKEKPLITQIKEQEKYRREFIGNVSHELKTPIFNIQGYILTLLDGAIEDPEVNIRYLKKAKKNIKRMIQLVKDLDLISKLDSGELQIEKENFDLLEVIEDVVEGLEIQATELDVEIDTVCTQLQVSVNADKDGIFKVLNNLIANSIKYGKKGGKTLIKITEKDHKVWVEIKDNGMGIRQEDISRIFERFYRVDKSRARNIAGSGLGLSIVKHIIEAHQEQILVTSEIEKGTSFKFSLNK